MHSESVRMQKPSCALSPHRATSGIMRIECMSMYSMYTCETGGVRRMVVPLGKSPRVLGENINSFYYPFVHWAPAPQCIPMQFGQISNAFGIIAERKTHQSFIHRCLRCLFKFKSAWPFFSLRINSASLGFLHFNSFLMHVNSCGCGLV